MLEMLYTTGCIIFYMSLPHTQQAFGTTFSLDNIPFTMTLS